MPMPTAVSKFDLSGENGTQSPSAMGRSDFKSSPSADGNPLSGGDSVPTGAPVHARGGGGVLPAGNGGGYGMSGSGAMSLDEGGAIPDPSETDPGNQPVDLGAALTSVKGALAYGRKQAGLSGPDGGQTQAGADTQAQGFDEGGGVLPQPGADDGQDQGAPQQGGGNPSASYITGAGGVTPDIAAAMEGRVDPQGAMDPSSRKLLAIGQAGSPDQQFKLMQHYRQKFNAYNAYAKAAVKGTPQKPADINASTQAATQAYQNVPDGTSLNFAPTQGGVAVSVKHLAKGQDTSGAQSQQNDAQGDQSFQGGGSVDHPKTISGVLPALGDEHNSVLTELQADAAKRAAARVKEGQGSEDNDSYAEGGAVPDEGESDDTTGSIDNSDTTVNLSLPQYHQFLSQDGQYDSIMDKGAKQVLTQVAQNMQGPQGPEDDQGNGGGVSGGGPGSQPTKPPMTERDAMQRAGDLYPLSHQAAQRQAYAQKLMEEQQKGQQQLENSKTIWGGHAAVAQGTNASREVIQDKKGVVSTANNQNTVSGRVTGIGMQQEGANSRNQNTVSGANSRNDNTNASRETIQDKKGAVSTANNQNTVAGRQGVAETNANQRAATAQQQSVGRMIDAMIANGDSPQKIMNNIPMLAAKAGLQPREAMQYLQGRMSGQPPMAAPAQGSSSHGAPQSQGGQQPPVPGAKLYQGKWYTRGPNGDAVPVQ